MKLYNERRKVLDGEDLKDSILKMIHDVIERAVNLYSNGFDSLLKWDLINLNEFLLPIFHKSAIIIGEDSSDDTNKNDLVNKTKQDIIEKLFDEAKEIYISKENEFGSEQMREIERVIALRMVDQHWMDHIDNMDQMRQGISLRAYAQRDPLVEYKFLSYDMFEEMSNNIQLDTVRGLFNVRIEVPPEREQISKEISTNSDSVEKKPIQRKEAKVGRNDPCPCGSGKKYKQCCGKNDS